MEKFRLISMTDFVLEHDTNQTSARRLSQIIGYAEFLKQNLKLEMFVPCVDGEPFNYSKHGNSEQYEQAKEKVLFEGFKTSLNSESVYLIEDEYINFEISNKKIETLIYCDLTLTQNAIKQFLK